jgi:hypothetical protein
MAEEQGRG